MGQVAVTIAITLCASSLSAPARAQAPGPELFAKEPHTPLELWEAIDYLMRTDQAKKALPYLDKFMKSKPDNATLITIRNRYGPGSILRLSDNAATQPFAEPMVKAMVEAAHQYATRPERTTKLISELTKTPDEEDYAIRHLREAGPEAIPLLVKALSRPDQPANDRQQIVRSMSHLDRSVIPPLAAVLASPDPALAADAARVLAAIGDKEAVPFLAFPAASPGAAPVVQAAAQAAITHLTGQPYPVQPSTPVQSLTASAWRYHRHQVEFADDPVAVWHWDKDHKVLISRRLPQTEADATLGLQFAGQALQLDPHNHDAQVAQLSLALEKSIAQVGLDALATKDEVTWNAAKARDPSILGDVLKTAITDSKTDLATAVTRALGQITDPTALAATGRPHPLVDALYAPARRTQFAAASALVNLAPTSPFPGSSRVIPTLARFVSGQVLPRAVVIDGNPNRGSQLAGFLTNLGYDAELEPTGKQGFLTGTESADVELMLISYDLFQTGWSLNDMLANLRADSRTAAVPVYIYGPINLQYKRPNLERDYPGIKFLVQPGNPDVLRQQLKELPPPLGEAERSRYAREAATLLARIATVPKGPLRADLTAAQRALTIALSTSLIAPVAAVTLAEIANPDAQRSLANLVLDPSQPAPMRNRGAALLAHSIKRFGRLITADQEVRLVTSLQGETDLGIRADLLTILRTLLPVPPSRLPRPAVPPPLGPAQRPTATIPAPPQPPADL
jgi:HEAT repeat protein